MTHEQLLHAVEQMPTNEIDDFVARVMTVRENRVAPPLSAQELELFRAVRQALPPEFARRHRQLSEKLAAELLSEAEHAEFASLVDLEESLNVVRLQALTQLCKLRGLGFREMLQQLGMESFHEQPAN